MQRGVPEVVQVLHELVYALPADLIGIPLPDEMSKAAMLSSGIIAYGVLILCALEGAVLFPQLLDIVHRYLHSPTVGLTERIYRVLLGPSGSRLRRVAEFESSCDKCKLRLHTSTDLRMRMYSIHISALSLS